MDILNSRKEEFNSWRKWCFDDRKDINMSIRYFKSVTFIAILSLVFAVTVTQVSFAEDTKGDVKTTTEVGAGSEEYRGIPVDPPDGSQKTDGYYVWKVTSKKVDGYPFGSWRRGPSGKGPATLSFGQQGSYDRKVTITISGSYTSKWTIGNALGVTIGEKKAYSTNYKVYVPKKKRYQILYRPQYKEYKVVETKFYKIDGYESKTSDRKVSYVRVFSNWDYTWKKL